jgi:DNA-binding MarR family transcriptional regulator
MNRDFKGIWIPKEVWLSEKITMMEKIFIVEISSLDNKKGCWANNNYFAGFFGLSTSRVSEIINSLCDKKLLVSTIDQSSGNRRILRLTEEGISLFRIGSTDSTDTSSENAQHNNTFNNPINNTINNKEKPLRAIGVLPFLSEEFANAWIEWETFRKEIKKKITPSTAKKQLTFLGGRGEPEAIAIINQSITNGWTGLFALKNGNNGTGTIKDKRTEHIEGLLSDFNNR